MPGVQSSLKYKIIDADRNRNPRLSRYLLISVARELDRYKCPSSPYPLKNLLGMD